VVDVTCGADDHLLNGKAATHATAGYDAIRFPENLLERRDRRPSE
jgi:hypothetical protein